MKARIHVTEFNRLITATKKFVGASMAKEVHQWIRLDFCETEKAITASACDGHRLSVEKTQGTWAVEGTFTAYIRPNIGKLRKSRRFNVSEVVDLELCGDRLLIEYKGSIHGFKQPCGEGFDHQKAIDDSTQSDVVYRIGFNPRYLVDALQSFDTPSTLREAIVLEFRDPQKPAFIKMRGFGDRMVLPVRLKEGCDYAEVRR